MTAVTKRTENAVELELIETTDEASTRRRLPSIQLPPWLDTASPAMIWIGLVLTGIGFGLIFYTWAQVAGETQVYLQLPYFASAGLPGLALIVVGMTVINVSAKRRDAVERGRQIDQLVSILEEVQGALTERGSRRR